jgi:hypothetical protein
MDTGKSLHVEVFYIFIYGHKNLAQDTDLAKSPVGS